MRLPSTIYATCAGILALCLTPASGFAQSKPEFIPFQGTVKGVLYKPDSGPVPHVGILVMHRTSNYLTHPACTELSKRGFMLLCMTTRYENNETMVDFEKLPLDVKRGVEFLRRQPGISKVLLFGHSGGGPLMSLYQAVAENGPAYCKGPNKLSECGDDLAGLPAADGIVFADPNPGNSVNTLRRINPAVASENNPPDGPPVAALDMFDPKNGYNPNGPSNYSPEFQARYFKAQADRMNGLIGMARARLDTSSAATILIRTTISSLSRGAAIRVPAPATPSLRCSSHNPICSTSMARRNPQNFCATMDRWRPRWSEACSCPIRERRTSSWASAPAPRFSRCGRF